LQAVFDGPNLIGEVPDYDELVRNDATGCISARQWIREAQRHLPNSAAPCRRLVLEIRERTFVGGKGIRQLPIEKETKSP
jgi:hypothetical protein